MAEFQRYQRVQVAELRPYEDGESMRGIAVNEVDADNGSPMEGDMIARNPKDHSDQWLVAKQYFEDNFEPVEDGET